MLRIKQTLFAGIALASIASSAQASFLDTDFWCRTYGCAVVHDGVNLDIYDNWVFATNSCCVPVGAQMIPFSNTAGNTNVTGFIGGNGANTPDADEGFIFGITQDGTTIHTSLIDDGDGFLDAADTLGAVSYTHLTLPTNREV